MKKVSIALYPINHRKIEVSIKRRLFSLEVKASRRPLASSLKLSRKDFRNSSPKLIVSVLTLARVLLKSISSQEDFHYKTVSEAMRELKK